MLRMQLGRSMAKPKTAKSKTVMSTQDSKPRTRVAGAVAIVLAGLLLIARGVDNAAVTVVHVQMIAPGAFAVQVVFVVTGLAVLLRGLDGLWGVEVRSASGRLVGRWRRWRAAGPPARVAGALPGVPPDRNPLFRDRETEMQMLRNPYGRFRLDMERQLDLEVAAPGLPGGPPLPVDAGVE
jgi:hypothetical protein